MANKIHQLHNVIYRDSVYGDIAKIFYVVENVNFGIDTSNNWVQLINTDQNVNRLENNLAVFSEHNDTMLALLEINVNELKKELAKSLQSNKFSSLLSEIFPYELVVLNGLYSQSDWWVNLALDWFMSLPVKSQYDYERLISLIKSIKNDKSYEQKIRHKAQKALAKYNKANHK